MVGIHTTRTSRNISRGLDPKCVMAQFMQWQAVLQLASVDAFFFTLEQSTGPDSTKSAGSIGLSPTVTNPVVRQHITCLPA